MLRNKKNIFKISLMAVVVVLLVASVGTVAAQDDGESETGELRVVHASPDAPNVDVYVDGDAVLEDVEFGAASEYLELPPDTYQVEVTAAGDADTSVFDEEVEVGDGDYTALAIGELAEDSETPFTVEVLEDDNSPTNEGEARVRAVHASPDAPNVDITVESTGDALFEDVAFGDAAYVSVPEGEYTLEIRAAQDDNQGDVVTTFDLNAEAGGVYSAFAVGYLSPDDAPGDEEFGVVPTLDAEPGEAEPTATVTFEDQMTDGNSVEVASTTLPEGGFVTIHDSSLNEGDAIGSVVGVSDYLGEGSHEGVTVELDESIEEDQTLIAMPHFDTNGNEEYDFVDSEGGEDGPYTADGSPVVSSAQITVGAEPSVTFEDQTLGDDGAVDVSVNDAALSQGSWLVVTYEEDGSLVIAGVSQIGDANDVTVTVEDAGGFPGTHTAHVISELSTEDYAPGDTVSEETAGNVLVNSDAEVTEGDGDGGMEDGMDGADDGTGDGMDDGDMDGNDTTDGGEGDGDDGDGGGQGMPGFTAVAALVALVALVAAALVARRLE